MTAHHVPSPPAHQARLIPPTSGTVPLVRVVSGSLVVWGRSSLWYLALGAVAAGALAVLLAAPAGPQGWDRMLAHLNMWCVAVGPMLVAIVAGIITGADRRGAGGTSLRAVRPADRTTAAVITVLAWTLLVTTVHGLTVLAAYWVLHGAEGVSLVDAAGDMLTVTALLVAASPAYVVLLRLMAERWGAVGAGMTAACFVVGGALTAESTAWRWTPSAWLLRPVLPVIGTHANGTDLGAESITGGATAIASSVVLALVLLAARHLFTRHPGGRAHRARRSLPALFARPAHRAAPRPGTSSPTPVTVASQRRSGAVVLALVVGVLCAWLCRYRSTDEVAAVAALLFLPLIATVQPVRAVPRWRSGIRACATRAVRPGTLALGLVGSQVVVVALCSAVVAAVLVLDGLSLESGAVVLGTFTLVGALIAVLTTLVAAALGSVPAIVLGTIGLVAGVLVGGNDTLRSSLGAYVPWCWAIGPDAFTLVASAVLAVVLSLGAAWSLSRQTEAMR